MGPVREYVCAPVQGDGFTGRSGARSQGGAGEALPLAS